MSGHSKWSQIKRKKEINDKKKGQIFSKISRLITLAVIKGGGVTDPEYNLSLRLAIEQAKKVNMPKENIKRAIAKGIGEDKDKLKEIIYEGFGPYKVPFIILALIDNVNRTLPAIKHVVESKGGKLANKGAVSYLFNHCGLVSLKKSEVKEEEAFSIADKLNAFDMNQDEEYYFLYIPFENLGKVGNEIKGINFEAEETYKPISPVVLKTEEEFNKLTEFVEEVEDLEDVQKVFLAT